MRFLSVCSGIEAASVAWSTLGWKAVAFSEIDPFACSVLAHHYGSGRPAFMPPPDAPGLKLKDRRARAAAIKQVDQLPARAAGVPNHGDLIRFQEWPEYAVDLVCGGTPCQAFSVAGLRQGLADPRGNLALTFLAIVDRYRPQWVLWENVPGVLSSNGGRDFASFLGGLGLLGYGWCYRVLDAQYVRVDGYDRAVPQRRRRVFVVGYLGDWRRAAAVLSEPESVLGDHPPRRSARAGVAGALTGSLGRRGGQSDGGDTRGHLIASVSPTLRAGGNRTGGDRPPGTDVDTAETLIAMAHGQAGALAAIRRGDGKNETLLSTPAIAFNGRQDPDVTGDRAGSLNGMSPQDQCIAFQERGREGGRSLEVGGDVAYSLNAPSGGGRTQEGNILQGWAVRRLTPLECERLQGFPDGYTDIPYRGKPAADGPRYKALGNSWAVNAARWIGYRIQMVDEVWAEIQTGRADG